MTTMISEVYEAFREADVSDATARKASEAIAAYEARFASLDLKFERLEASLTIVKWGQGVTLAGVIAILIKLFVV